MGCAAPAAFSQLTCCAEVLPTPGQQTQSRKQAADPKFETRGQVLCKLPAGIGAAPPSAPGVALETSSCHYSVFGTTDDECEIGIESNPSLFAQHQRTLEADPCLQG